MFNWLSNLFYLIVLMTNFFSFFSILHCFAKFSFKPVLDKDNMLVLTGPEYVKYPNPLRISYDRHGFQVHIGQSCNY